jgi:glycosyltransferase involved in cell wall biosynthesis
LELAGLYLAETHEACLMTALSVLMPVYNAERYVAEAVESILAQTYSDFEFLIINDGSTDGSLKILRRYERQDSRIRLISRANTGYVVALNEMLDLARGEYIARMDADDMALPERFARQVDYLRANPECLAVGSMVLLVDAEGEPLRPFFVNNLTHEEIDRAHLSGKGGALAHPAAMMRCAALRAIGGYHTDAFPVEDLDLFLRLAERGRLANLPEVLLHHRRHSAAIGYTHLEQRQRMQVKVLREAYRRRGMDPERETFPVRYPLGSHAENHQMWAWWAWGAGNLSTARKHAFAAFLHNPLHVESWRLVYCVLRRKLRSSDRPPRHQVDPLAKLERERARH